MDVANVMRYSVEQPGSARRLMKHYKIICKAISQSKTSIIERNRVIVNCTNRMVIEDNRIIVIEAGRIFIEVNRIFTFLQLRLMFDYIWLSNFNRSIKFD